jgi:Protein of unknown function (DUF4054)
MFSAWGRIMNGTNPPVVFNYETWIAMFPEFSQLSQAQGNAYFIRATTSIIGNVCSNPANADGKLEGMIYLATSHVAWLSCPRDANGNPAATGQPGSPLVGRISSAQEGSVNVQTEWEIGGPQTQFDAYLQQTKYGVELLAALATYRTARYLPQRRPVVLGGPYPGFWRY